jgi:hypothetical protein
MTDFEALLKTAYKAKRSPERVCVPPGVFLAVDGRGAPGAEGFQAAIQALYASTYTIKFTMKFAGELDFKVGRLECLYFTPPPTPMDQWKWRMLIRVPQEVKAGHLRKAAVALKKRGGPDISGVRRIRWSPGQAVQILHVGLYDQVKAAYERLHAFGRELGLNVTGPAQEIYLNDPRRTAPAKLKTIVRLAARA